MTIPEREHRRDEDPSRGTLRSKESHPFHEWLGVIRSPEQTVGVRFAFSERFGIGGGVGSRCELRGRFWDWFFVG